MKGFFAYSSASHVQETVRASIAEARRSHVINEISDWAELDIAGHFIATEVLRSIDQSDFLVADITLLNFNVTYELGYAIGRGKRVLIVRNEAYGKSQDEKIRRLGIYDTLGYKGYENSVGLAAIIKAVNDADPLLREMPPDVNQPLYVTKTRYQSDWSIRIAARLKKTGLAYRSFDPKEQPRLSALDAISQVNRSIGVLVHFVPVGVDDSEIHNLRCAFISGLADGMDKAVSFLQEGYDPIPLDYRDFVVSLTHHTKVDEAVADLAGEVVARFSAAREAPTDFDSTTLEKLSFGASSAENEITDLADYYLATDEFRRALQGEARLVVGRKGAGKSAIFFRVRDKVASSRKNVVLDLKPDGYQLVKLKDRVLGAMSKGTQEHTITAFWHCVLILELARSALHGDKTSHRLDDSIYKTYLQLEEKYKEYGYESGQGDFAERISSLIYRIESKFMPSGADHAVELSAPEVTALIYDNDVKKLSDAIFDHLKIKDSVWILFDNIDKGWTPTGIDALDILTLRALLEASRKLQRDLISRGVDAKFLVFLRNDVYELLIDQTADRGKEQKVIVDWRDQDALKQLVALRMSASLSRAKSSLDELWPLIAVSHVHGESSYQYVVDRCLMRPRYLLDLLRYARGRALTLRHEKILEDDIDKAIEFFSSDVVQDTNLELRDVFPAHDGLLYSFIGVESRLSKEDVRKALIEFGVEEILFEKVVSLLLWYGFLGVEDEAQEPQYIYNRSYNNKLFDAYVRSRLAQHAMLVINPAFWDGLDIHRPTR